MTEVTRHDPGSFSWTELATNDTRAAKSFYTALFGWTVTDGPMGPGAEDVLSPDQAMFFEPEDATSLEHVLSRGWNSDQERRRIAAGGAAHAESLKGEENLLGNILHALDKAL